MISDAQQRLLERRQRLVEQLAELEKQVVEQRRKDNRRRAELAGKAVLRYAESNPHFAEILRGILDTSISAKRDRDLFDLESEPADPAEPNPERREILVGVRQAIKSN